MPVSEAKKRANAKYTAKTYEKATFHFNKGKKEDYKAHAAKLGLSFNAFVVNAIEDAMQRDAGRAAGKETP